MADSFPRKRVQQPGLSENVGDLLRRVRDLEMSGGYLIPPHDTIDIAIDLNTSGDHTLVSGVANYQIQVVGGVLIASAGMSLKFKDSTPTDKSGVMTVGQTGQGFALAIAAHFKCATGKGLVLNLGSATQIGGFLSYRLITP